jgi:hypothetical protein
MRALDGIQLERHERIGEVDVHGLLRCAYRCWRSRVVCKLAKERGKLGGCLLVKPVTLDDRGHKVERGDWFHVKRTRGC